MQYLLYTWSTQYSKLTLRPLHRARKRSIHACIKRLVHNTTQNNALHCVAFTSTLVETQYDARIDSDPILVLPCVVFLHLVVKKSQTFLRLVHKVMQDLALR